MTSTYATPAVSVPAPRARRGTSHRLLRSFRKNPLGMLSATYLVAVVVAAILAPAIAPYNPVETDVVHRLIPPIWTSGDVSHLLGTDQLGRDILSRIIHGARISLVTGLASVLIQSTVGMLCGLFAGYYRRIDNVLMRIADVQLSIPFLILALAVITVLGPGLNNVILVLGLTGWVGYARVIRGQVLSIREREFTEAARALGASNTRIIFRHIMPNVFAAGMVIGTLQTASMITAEASLSYLGLGVQPPTPAWGVMVADGRDLIALAWWVATLPGLAILVTVVAINLLGDWLREALDPRLKLT
ncbi:MAG: ABC transporter permease [Chloroflexi bacterium]|nr:ABC transporter permease [Chloroflexota bacterium]